MSESIKISKEHGLNPSLVTCFFCGKDKEIALFGRLPHDQEAPHRVMIDYEPCAACKQKFADGVLLIECSETAIADGQRPIQDGAFPTGNYCVVTQDAFTRMFNVDQPPKAVALVDMAVMTAIMKNVESDDSG